MCILVRDFLLNWYCSMINSVLLLLLNKLLLKWKNVLVWNDLEWHIIAKPKKTWKATQTKKFSDAVINEISIYKSFLQRILIFAQNIRHKMSRSLEFFYSWFHYLKEYDRFYTIEFCTFRQIGDEEHMWFEWVCREYKNIYQIQR